MYGRRQAVFFCRSFSFITNLSALFFPIFPIFFFMILYTPSALKIFYEV